MNDAAAIDEKVIVAEAICGDGLHRRRNQTFDTGNIFNFFYCH
jgi:hypothetical protein